jgi:O-antigen/teichoic acid export membrane protein
LNRITVSQTSTIVQELSAAISGPSGSIRATIFRNIAASFLRVVAVSLVALILPAYLIHHLSVQTYAAWVLIIQLGAYVSYLDLGIQTAVSKFVAEYDAKNNYDAAGRHASAGFVLMTIAGTLGLGLTLVLAWQVPTLFAAMPSHLYHDVRVSVVLVGSSLSFSLVCAVYSAVFLGLQRYWIPTAITILNRGSFAAIVIAVVALHGSLVAMGLAAATVNVFTSLLQVLVWRQKASHVRISPRLVESRTLKSVGRFCSLQSIWTIGMLCIAGLDITIVGHYDYPQTAYYSIATLPTNFMLMIVAAALGPLMPASSAMSTQRSPVEMGSLLARATRYSTLVLLAIGLPLIVLGLPILRFWVGSSYAVQAVSYLRILVFANIVRNLCAPYATMIVATNRQAAATAAAISEGVVNLWASILLASHFGAIGVAIGTLLGSFVSVFFHFIVTMRFTSQNLAITRSRLMLEGMLRPSVVAVPTLLIFPLWARTNGITVSVGLLTVWILSTAMLALFLGLNREERMELIHFAKIIA